MKASTHSSKSAVRVAYWFLTGTFLDEDGRLAHLRLATGKTEWSIRDMFTEGRLYKAPAHDGVRAYSLPLCLVRSLAKALRQNTGCSPAIYLRIG